MKAGTISPRAAIRALATMSALLTPIASMAAAASGPAVTSSLVGRTADARPITVSLFLPSRDPVGARDFVAHVGTPGDPLYHRYLTPAEYAERFGASQADYDVVVGWAKSRGLTVGEHFAGRTIIPVSGTAASMSAALGVSFNDYRDAKGAVFYAANVKPRLPDEVAAKLGGIVGLSDFARYRPLVVHLPAGQRANGGGTGPLGAYSAADLRSIYSVPTLNFGHKTQTLAVFEQGGFDPDDVAVYLARNNLPSVPVKARSVNGYGTGIDDPGVEGEAVLDIDMLIAINPQAKKILVYEDGADSFQEALVDSFAAMASDGVARTISVSYGQDEIDQGADAIAAEHTVLTQLAAQGQAVFVSSGDGGAYGEGGGNGLNVPDPASQPLVTSVGGTTVFTNTDQTYNAETTWNSLGEGGATGGGISTIWPFPRYQGKIFDPSFNGGSVTYRNVPDVASLADPYTGVAVYSKLNGGWLSFGGTSASSPMWAGFYSLVTTASDAFGFGPTGFANPSLYSTYAQYHRLSFFVAGGSPNAQIDTGFNDIQTGTNGNPNLNFDHLPGFFAGRRYDNTTGLGSFDINLLPNLVFESVIAPHASNPPPAVRGLDVKTLSTTATLTWTKLADVRAYAVYLYTFTSRSISPVIFTVSTKATVDFAGLKPNTVYAVKVVSATPGGFAISPQYLFTTPK